MDDNITITKIILTNFKAHKSLELSLGAFNIIVGENGSGKTTILDAICYGLFGIVANGAKKSELIANGEKTGGVTLILSNGYKIVRNFSTDIRLLDNNDKLISNKASDIESFLNLNKEVFMNILYASQNEIYTPFLKFNAKEKDFIDNIFNLDTFTDTIVIKLKETINTLNIRYNDLMNKITMKKTLQQNINEMLLKCNVDSIAHLERLVKVSNSNLQEFLNKRQQYNDKQSIIYRYRQQKLLLENLNITAKNITESMNQSNRYLDDIKNQLYNFIEDVNKNTNTTIDVNNIQAWYNQLDSNCNINMYLTNIKELIKDALSHKEDVDFIVSKLEDILNIITTIEKLDEYRSYYSALKDNYNKLINSVNAQVTIINNYKAQFDNISKQINDITGNINSISLPDIDSDEDVNKVNDLALQYQEQYTTLKTTLDNAIIYSNQLNSFVEDIDVSSLDTIQKNIQSLNNILTIFNRDGFVSFLRKSILKDIANNIGGSLEKFGFSKLLPVAIDGKTGALLFHNRHFKLLSGGEKSCIGVLWRLLYSKVLAPSMRLNIMLLDEPASELDSIRVTHFRELLNKINSIMNTQLIIVTHDNMLISEKAKVVNISSL